ncbi:mechanosensitive ion channel family protein [Rhodococcus sp. ACT016]|uniref:mechanosensitive ion channel family protein n=1 Tax=Rhodococcus sp. ACT016 TaxID=3134808 RepID=UPI003D2C0DE1
MPSIFIDIARLALIIVGLAVLFSQVWGANVAGLFAALGVTSIVIGLAIQNAVGPVVAGLLLLFEQPFTLGDWLESPVVRGRVVEVNWRAVHIDTGNGIQVVPNAQLAAAAFTNLSRVGENAHKAKAELQFAVQDPPVDVIRVVTETAQGLPMVARGGTVSVSPGAEGVYAVSIPVASPADDGGAKSLLLQRLWYASRRAGLHLDDAPDDDFDSLERRTAAASVVSAALKISGDDLVRVAEPSRLVRTRPALARRFGEAIDSRRESVRTAQAEATAQTPSMLPVG